MPTGFSPIGEMKIYCRFCKKVLPVKLERSIADSGKTVDSSSTYEYICTKCGRSHCFYGEDLLIFFYLENHEKKK